MADDSINFYTAAESAVPVICKMCGSLVLTHVPYVDVLEWMWSLSRWFLRGPATTPGCGLEGYDNAMIGADNCAE